MKNIHLIPTDKPSRLSILNSGKLNFGAEIMSSSNSNPQHIYITNDEEIKEGDWYENNGVIFKADDVFDEGNNPNNSNPRVTDFNNKIILTTDPDLIKDGVQAIDDEFLEWFVKNANESGVPFDICEVNDWLDDNGNIAFGSKERYKIIIPNEEPTAYHYLSCCRSIEECHCGKYPKQIKCYCGHTTMCDCSPIDEPKQETLEEAAESYARKQCDDMYDDIAPSGGSWGWETSTDFIRGAEWQQERMLKFILDEDNHTEGELGNSCIDVQTLVYFIEQFKKK